MILNRDLWKVTLLATVALVLAAVIAPSRADTPPATATTGLDPHDIYVRSVDAMEDMPAPRYLTYVLHVDANHIDITRGYDRSGFPTTELHFGVSHRSDTYRVSYRASDGKSLTKDLTSGVLSVGPAVPWSLDFSNLATMSAPSPNETVSANSMTTDAAGTLLGQLDLDQSAYYRITLAPDSSPSSYHLMLENATGDPNAHALRELFVDPQTFRIQSATFEVGQRRFLFGGTLRLHVDFTQVGPYWLNTSGRLDGAGHYTLMPLHGSYSYRASNIEFPQILPSQMFVARTAD